MLFDLWGAQIETSATTTRYQRVNTATDYDTAGFPFYTRYDAIDDSETSATGGGATSGVFICTAVRPSGVGTVRDLWGDTGTNTGWRLRINAANQLEFAGGNGTAYVTATTVATLPANATAVVTGWHDGTTLRVQINQGAVFTAALASVAAGTAGFTLGKTNGAATNFFGGGLYPVVYRSGTPVTAAEIANTQRYVANRSGVTI